MALTRIDVTQQHIDEGRRGSPSHGVLSLSLANVLRPGINFTVGTSTVSFGAGKSALTWECTIDLPLFAKNAASDWDRGKYIRPFSFTLDIPDEYLRLELREATL